MVNGWRRLSEPSLCFSRFLASGLPSTDDRRLMRCRSDHFRSPRLPTPSRFRSGSRESARPQAGSRQSFQAISVKCGAWITAENAKSGFNRPATVTMATGSAFNELEVISCSRHLAAVGLTILTVAWVGWDEAEARAARQQPRERAVHGPSYRPPYAAIVVDDNSGGIARAMGRRSAPSGLADQDYDALSAVPSSSKPARSSSIRHCRFPTTPSSSAPSSSASRSTRPSCARTR